MRQLWVTLTLALSLTSPVFAEEIPGLSRIPEADFYTGKVSSLTFFTPYDGGNAELVVLHLIADSKMCIRMACYGFTDPVLCDALIEAHKRGVDVSIVMDATQAAGEHQKILVDKLREAGVSLAIGRSPVHSALLHAKFIVVDHMFVEYGSWNFSESASEQFNTVEIDCDQQRAEEFLNAWSLIHEHLTGYEDGQ